MVGTSLESFDFYVFAYFSAYFIGPLFFEPLGEFGAQLARVLDGRRRVHRAPDRRRDLRLHGRPARPAHHAALDGRRDGRRDRPHRPAADLRAGRLARRRAAGAAAHRAGPVARRRVGRLHPARDRALGTRQARVLRVDPAARLAGRLDPLRRAVHRHDDRRCRPRSSPRGAGASRSCSPSRCCSSRSTSAGRSRRRRSSRRSSPRIAASGCRSSRCSPRARAPS